MKKQSASAHPTSSLFTHAHMFMMALGILTAVMCSFVLLGSTPEGKESLEDWRFSEPAPLALDGSLKVSAWGVMVSILGHVAQSSK
jgi:hypothetical protein